MVETEKQQISDWERGKRMPQARSLELLAAALECEWWEFYMPAGR
jgi:transcriptional regulator with XRE-family HTH domain